MSEQVDPAHDPAVRAEAHRAVEKLLWNVKDILWRYSTSDGEYIEPTGIADGGDVTGVINAAMNQVVVRLQDAANEARAELAAVEQKVHDYKRQLYGDGYEPVRNPLFNVRGGEHR
jgi:GTPase